MALPRTLEENKFLFAHFTAMEKLLSTISLVSPATIRPLVELTKNPATALSGQISLETFESLRTWVLRGDKNVKRLTLLAIYLAIMSTDENGKHIANGIRSSLRNPADQTSFALLATLTLDPTNIADDTSFMALCGAVSVMTGPEKLNLVVVKNASLSEARFVQLCHAIAVVPNINMIRWAPHYYPAWSDKEFDGICKVISKLPSLDSIYLLDLLKACSIKRCNTFCLPTLCTALQTSTLRSVYLDVEISDESLKMLGSGMAKMPNLEELHIGLKNGLPIMNHNIASIITPRIKKLRISGSCLLHTINFKDFLNFCQAVTSPFIESLSFDDVGLTELASYNFDRFKLLCGTIQAAQGLRSFSLNFNGLYLPTIPPRGILEPLFHIASNFNLESFDMNLGFIVTNFINQHVTDSELENLCRNLENAHLNKFSFSGFRYLLPPQRLIFLTTIARNMNIQSLYLGKKIKSLTKSDIDRTASTIQDASQRHLYLMAFADADEIAELFRIRFETLNQYGCLKLAKNVELFLQNGPSDDLNKICQIWRNAKKLLINLAIVENLLRNLFKIHGYLFPTAWLEAVKQNALLVEWQAPNMLFEMGEINTAITQWSAISRQNPRYQDAHFAAFETEFLTSRSDKQPIHRTFVKALFHCVDDKQCLIIFADQDHQKRFDAFLFAAAGIDTGFQFGGAYNVSADTRNLLLRYVLLADIRDFLPGYSPNPSFFELKRVGLKAMLEDYLPIVTKLDELTTQESRINDIWADAMKWLDDAPLVDEKKNLLITVVKALPMESLQQTAVLNR